MSTCLSDQQIEQMFTGALADAHLEDCLAHIASCAACAARHAACEKSIGLLYADLREIGDAAPVEPAKERPGGGACPDIDGYEIEDELGRGGQGIVYRARQRHTRRLVAIKILREGPYASASARRRFEREVELAAQLQHPNIVTVFHSGMTQDGRQYCVMDYVEGLPLDEHVLRQQLAIDVVLRLFAEVCTAVNYAHQRGIIHRDIKPSNILVDCRGTPRVMDFGLAKMTADATGTMASLSGQIIGTPAFMAPEQTTGRPGDTDTRTDIYALGVVLFRLLTGVYPYPVDGPIGEVVHHINETEPARLQRAWSPGSGVARLPTQTRCPIEDDVQTIALKALAKEPDRRYQTALDLAADVHRYLADEPIAARRSSTWYVLSKTVRRHRVRCALAMALLLSIIGATVTLSIMVHRQAQLLEEIKTQRSRVLDMASTFVTDLNSLIEPLQGATEARKLLTTTAVEYLDKLAAESADDDDVILSQAQAYLRIGIVQGGPNYANLGETAAARSSLEKSLELTKRLLAVDPDDPRYLRLEASGLEGVGDLLSVSGDTAGALESFEKAAEITARLAERHPGDPQVLNMLAWQRDKVGDMYKTRGNVDGAVAHYTTSLEGRLARLPLEPDNLELKRSVFISYVKIANVERDRGAYAAALRGYRAGLDITLELAAERPDALRSQRDLYIIHSQIGFTLLMDGQMSAAVESYAACVDIAERLAATDASDVRARNDLATALVLLADAELQLEDLESALHHYERCRTLLTEIIAADPRAAVARTNQAACHNKIGIILARTGHTEDAIINVHRGHEMFQTLFDEHPDHVRFERNHAESLYDAGLVHLECAERLSPSDLRRDELVHQAAAWLERSDTAFEAMVSSGRFLKSDSALHETIRAARARCSSMLSADP